MRSEEPNKDIEAKKTSHLITTNQTSYSSGQAALFNQAIGRSKKKDSCLCRGSNKG